VRLLTSAEHPLEMESRLRIAEADARWRRQREMIIVWTGVLVALITSAAGTFTIVSKTATPSDRQLAFLVLGELIALMFTVLFGKTIKWRR